MIFFINTIYFVEWVNHTSYLSVKCILTLNVIEIYLTFSYNRIYQASIKYFNME